MDFAEAILAFFALLGTVAFAISGAMIAIEKNVDLFGVAFLGLTTAMGGGMLRDLLLGKTPPALFFDVLHTAAAVATALLVFTLARVRRAAFLRHKALVDRVNNCIDALGLGACSVTGARLAMEAGFSAHTFLVVSMGMLTAVGGGMLRDLLLREIPVIFRRHIYALASILGAGVYLALCRWGCAEATAAFAGVAATFLLRMAATHFDWNLPRAFPDGEKGDWRTPGDPV